MMKPATLFWTVLAVCAGIALFIMKYEVGALEEQLGALNHDIAGNQQAVHVLKAEWSYLNRPARLEDLGSRLLKLKPLDGSQTGTIDDIPMRPEGAGRPGAARPASVQTAPPAADHTSPHFARLRQAK